MEGTATYMLPTRQQLGGFASTSDSVARLDIKKLGDTLSKTKKVKHDIHKLGGQLQMKAMIPIQELFSLLKDPSPEIRDHTPEA